MPLRCYLQAAKNSCRLSERDRQRKKQREREREAVQPELLASGPKIDVESLELNAGSGIMSSAFKISSSFPFCINGIPFIQWLQNHILWKFTCISNHPLKARMRHMSNIYKKSTSLQIFKGKSSMFRTKLCSLGSGTWWSNMLKSWKLYCTLHWISKD